ncbi:hypothetical protein BOTCAL_0003g00070 [Botryotinia calthae]|uniref:Uncharacterized protein n=1 Tax=Botryotinia calthae TaxID=38488 RepID=A0A4Y8DJT2_9HELO|nr:hypothetical protein BOTCAL_0003g00070 [Botryotinia calthae]
MSNDLSFADPVNPPTAPQRSAAIVDSSGHWAVYHETIYCPDVPETSYYLLELETGRTTKLPNSAGALLPGSKLTNFIWTVRSVLLCQAQMNQTTYFFTLKVLDFALYPVSAGHVDTLITIFKAVSYVQNNDNRTVHVVLAVSGIGDGTTSARSSVGEDDVLGYSSRPVGQILRCLVFGIPDALRLPYINIESLSSDILENTNLKYVPFPTRMSVGPRNFDLDNVGLAFVAQTEEQSQAQHDGISDVYYIPFDQLPIPYNSKKPIPIKIETLQQGTASVPVFSPGRHYWLAFLKSNDHSTERSKKRIFKVTINKKNYKPAGTRLVLCQVEEVNAALNPVNLTWACSAPAQSKRLFCWADSQMSIVDVSIPLQNPKNPIICEGVLIDCGHRGSILGIDCLSKAKRWPINTGLLITRAFTNGSTDFLIYNADTREQSMVPRASAGEVVMEQNQKDSNEIGGNVGHLVEDGIIEGREEVINESNNIENSIIEDRVVEDREEVVNQSNNIEDRIIENREEDGSGIDYGAFDPPFPDLTHNGPEDSPLQMHVTHWKVETWREEIRRRRQ